MKTLSNQKLTIRVAEHGAELSGIVANATGKEYLWQADPAFWKRHSPVLFPIVGSVWNAEYRYAGVTYPLSQHGFARDMDFTLEREAANELLFVLEDTADTLRVYPFPFRLEIGYRLTENRVEVLWRVRNRGERTMHFQIGAHPAFYYPDYVAELDPDGLLPLNIHTFDIDTFILENSQIRRVDLLDLEKRPVLSLCFTAPVVGLWSPPRKNAPFVCIEPWYGRCDRAGYTGSYEERDWVWHLEPGEVFDASYTIEIAL